MCTLTGRRSVSEERGGLRSCCFQSCFHPQSGKKSEARRPKLAAACPFSSLSLAQMRTSLSLPLEREGKPHRLGTVFPSPLGNRNSHQQLHSPADSAQPLATLPGHGGRAGGARGGCAKAAVAGQWRASRDTPLVPRQHAGALLKRWKSR